MHSNQRGCITALAGEEDGGKKKENGKTRYKKKVLKGDAKTFCYCICLSVCIMRRWVEKWIAWCCHIAALGYVDTRGFDPGGAVMVQ